MAQSFSALFFHVIFSTRERRPLLTDDIRERLHPYVAGIVRRNGGVLRAVGGMPDHMHLLLSLNRETSTAEIMRLVKTNSSKWLRETFANLPAFAWKDGYAAFTVSVSNVESVRRYIERQAEHHRKRTFQEEFVEFLKRHGIEYDERRVWG